MSFVHDFSEVVPINYLTICRLSLPTVSANLSTVSANLSTVSANLSTVSANLSTVSANLSHLSLLYSLRIVANLSHGTFPFIQVHCTGYEGTRYVQEVTFPLSLT